MKSSALARESGVERRGALPRRGKSWDGGGHGASESRRADRACALISLRSRFALDQLSHSIQAYAICWLAGHTQAQCFCASVDPSRGW